jgi:hypothetical protein
VAGSGRLSRRRAAQSRIPRTAGNSVSLVEMLVAPVEQVCDDPDFGSRREPHRAWLLHASSVHDGLVAASSRLLRPGMVVRPWADRGPPAPTRPSRTPRPAGIPQATPGHANAEPHRARCRTCANERPRRVVLGSGRGSDQALDRIGAPDTGYGPRPRAASGCADARTGLPFWGAGDRESRAGGRGLLDLMPIGVLVTSVSGVLVDD